MPQSEDLQLQSEDFFQSADSSAVIPAGMTADMPQEALPCRWVLSSDSSSYGSTPFHKRIPVTKSRPTSCDWVKLDELGEVLLIAGENYELSLWDLGRSSSVWKYSVTQFDSGASQPAPPPSVSLGHPNFTVCKGAGSNVFFSCTADGSVQRWKCFKVILYPELLLAMM
ncbi:hypothetical protein VOLCADRAFT_100311 [Volvox carteri f. nagariensis]|uniref:Uncharacterized protein n=1 Tax=Volvox carteri f. nagariensis TaxID=3068 RepID=D8UJZ1_VOLCA|nr:uncharacterized protein VOLCADRAFT_100311 [Volvox carteri f. nagariensis]EFJ39958.1 hypothetical protein VOLCADRAFT_100311 [Volvox carteri f. nagariensis]|eukprot:XP_002958983.1 hypothetical protein VOLCADRAFT_100311 [Volvox carteri f. nagariensis]